MTDAKPRLAVHVSAEFAVETDLDLEGFHHHGELVMEELLKLEGCNDDFTDSTVATEVADESDRRITIELFFFTDSTVSAVQRAFHVMRTAVHASGGSTPNWPDADKLTEALTSPDADVEYQEPSIQTEPALV